ncbi:excalibur calcium-binding domain-containing protein [Streptomyces sp. NBC_01619]|uniref:excalibur calcium-binding domain-containing protein n=1 Tax=Streptomyces sp. NBC_01619 TaxID=2975901 RepID=UPI002254C874|nr:excalibur calcium-binding domain-containing protein [Streptomyces sp. NBC_01619]MCX4515001.1 excalibur calcium-binding domain-containing protein [Streptomyces sp. NBC_01619]
MSGQRTSTPAVTEPGEQLLAPLKQRHWAVGTKCPAEQGGKLHKPKPAPKPKPKPTPTPAPDDEDDSSSSTGGGGGGGSVYYRNCDAARDAGAAPVRRGDPGYGRHLDRDGDGVACE